jgi:DNA recombination protein RmuC
VTALVLVTALITAAAVGAAVFFALRSRPSDPGLSLLQQQLESLRGQMAEALSGQARLVSQQLEGVARTVAESQRSVGDRLDSASRAVGEVQKSLGELGQASQRIFEVGKDISGLTDLLRSPKMRGGLGEYFLQDLLSQILPVANFSIQHGFKGGHTVDAVVRLGARLVPVDAKFPLENFRKWTDAAGEDDRRAWRKKFAADVKKHVDAIASKYILPDEGTYDFALMYIPAENVYYECVVKPEEDEAPLMEYALKRRVVPVSPSSFYAYLQAIVLGLRGFQIEENARVIQQNLARLQGDVARFSDDFDLLGRHLSNAKTKHDDASRRLERVQDKLTSVAETSPATETPLPLALPPSS